MKHQQALVLVTGASSGIGFAVAQELASSGRYHVLIGARTFTKAETAIEQLVADPAFPVTRTALSPVALDLTSDASIAAAAQSVTDQFGSLDVLINSAGVSTGGADIGLRDNFRFVFETNVFGAAVLINSFLPLLRASTYRDRRIVNVTSGAGQIGLALSPDDRYNASGIPAPVYRSSKAALNMITAVHSMLLADEGITTMVAAPGPTRTRFSTGRGEKEVHEGARPIIRAATEGDPKKLNGTLVADELTEYGW